MEKFGTKKLSVKITSHAGGYLILRNKVLNALNANLCTSSRFTSKTSLFDDREGNDAIDSSVDSVVTTKEGAWASNLGATGLTNDNFTGADFLATKAFHTESLTGVIVDVFT
jgi:hypothetical protein